MVTQALPPTLSSHQLSLAAEALGAAFSQDPFMSYVFPQASTRPQKLTTLFRPIIKAALRYGHLELAPNAHGALAWISGEDVPLKLSQIIRSGLIWTPLQVGLSAFKRLETHEDFCEHIMTEKAPAGFAYLWIVGVHPEAAGKGFGKQMIQSALKKMKACGHSTCILRTDKANNVPLYEHLGFRQIHAGIEPISQLRYWLLSQDL